MGKFSNVVMLDDGHEAKGHPNASQEVDRGVR